MKYTAKVQHTEDSIKKLAKVQYDSYCIGTKLLMVAFAFVLLYFALFSQLNSGMKLAFIAAACWLAVSIEIPAKRNADKVIKALNGKFPSSDYVFEDSFFTASGAAETEKLGYDKLRGILSDNNNYYLFISRYSAYVVPKSSVEPNEPEKFKSFLEAKLGRSITRAGNYFGANILSALKTRQNENKWYRL